MDNEALKEWLLHPYTERLLEVIESDAQSIRDAWSGGAFLTQTDAENQRDAGVLEGLDMISDSMKEGTFLEVPEEEEDPDGVEY